MTSAAKKQRYERFRTEAFQDLQVFFHVLQVNPINAVESASGINDLQLVPLIAMMIYESYEDKNEFYNECLSFIEEHGADIIQCLNLRN